MKYYERLRHLREDRDLTQADIAKFLELPLEIVEELADSLQTA